MMAAYWAGAPVGMARSLTRRWAAATPIPSPEHPSHSARCPMSGMSEEPRSGEAMAAALQDQVVDVSAELLIVHLRGEQVVHFGRAVCEALHL